MIPARWTTLLAIVRSVCSARVADRLPIRPITLSPYDTVPVCAETRWM